LVDAERNPGHVLVDVEIWKFNGAPVLETVKVWLGGAP
jgi:hypothetical protein